MARTTEGDKGLSRRQFLIGSTLAGAGVAAAGLVGCSPSAPATESKVGGSSGGDASGTAGKNQMLDFDSKSMTIGTWPWSTPPADIPADQITSSVDVDVLVIGSGLAGCCAALAAKEEGAKVTIIEKSPEGTIAARGLDIAAFHTKKQQELVSQGLMEEPDYRQAIRRWVMWAQGRVKEPLLWLWARKSGACYDWMADKVLADGTIKHYVWNGYYKGPDYTEYPVTHAFYLAEYEQETFGFTFYNMADASEDDRETGDYFGNAILVPKLYEILKSEGIEIHYSMPSARLLRDGDGPVTGCIAGQEGAYTQYNASKAVIIATGDYAADKEMVQCYAPFQNYATDITAYFPVGVDTGDLHKQAMWVGAAMQKSEPHSSVTHLDFGAASYGFLHVTGDGIRFKNEDVNTQSKSITKALQHNKSAYTIYDSNGLAEVKRQVDADIGGGLQWGQLTQPIGGVYNLEAQEAVLKTEVETGMTLASDTLEGLAQQIGCDPAVFTATVERYNELCDSGNDVDFGKRSEILFPVKTGPFYAGKLAASLLTRCGGVRTDTQCRVLDLDDEVVENLYVCGSAAGDFFGAGDYPTFVAGIGHGRCVTFGRIAGIYAAGGDADKKIPSIDI
ncbi:MAG: FAD-dependent oxidoreductase [Coriobacteriales bacterium]|jgi:succinate dehydrogenase/fumarate reductase flavoprotein subunit|nr:FAD-dependent oxidoreductase [Coriobacteriales bacterium]